MSPQREPRDARDRPGREPLRMFIVLAVAVLAIVVLLVVGWLKLNGAAADATSARAHARAEVAAVASAQAATARLQHTLLVSQKASTQTRVSTVGQRCDLTNLILRVVRKADPVLAPPFAASWRHCQVQLAQVRHINARTPPP